MSSKSALKQFLLSGHNLLQKRTTEQVISTLNGHPLRLNIHQNPSVLASASLACAYIKNWITRNGESVTSGTIKRILGLCDYKNAVWKYKIDQRPRKEQYAQILRELKMKAERIACQLAFLSSEDPRHGHLKAELDSINENAGKVASSIALMKDSVTGSLHPEDTTSNDPNMPKLRGLLIRVAGPRKGNRAMVWERAVGAVSTNSVDYVVAEECKEQLPSKLGIFGLRMRMVYERCAQRPLQKRTVQLFDGNAFYRPFSN